MTKEKTKEKDIMIGYTISIIGGVKKAKFFRLDNQKEVSISKEEFIRITDKFKPNNNYLND